MKAGLLAVENSKIEEDVMKTILVVDPMRGEVIYDEKQDARAEAQLKLELPVLISLIDMAIRVGQ